MLILPVEAGRQREEERNKKTRLEVVRNMPGKLSAIHIMQMTHQELSNAQLMPRSIYLVELRDNHEFKQGHILRQGELSVCTHTEQDV